MATIDVGGSASRRELNHELPLVPFIDFLLCIVAFLLVTAVWSQMARLDADAKVPDDPAVTQPELPAAELHVDMRSSDNFVLEWRQRSILLAHDEVPRHPLEGPSGVVRFPDLSRAVHETWTRNGAHRSADDEKRDRAILHASNGLPFEEIVAAMDAIAATVRPTPRGKSEPAFSVVFAVD
jgi:biopolymer transport protein ExbD